MLHITKATQEDAKFIHAIQMRAFAEEGRLSNTREIPPLMESVESIEQFIESQTVLMARDGDQIVGSARGIVEGSVCTIRGVLVEPSYHGKGVGGSLLHAVEQRHPEIERFELTTNTLVPGNVQFYERRGYNVYEFTKYGEIIVLAQMSKQSSAIDAQLKL